VETVHRLIEDEFYDLESFRDRAQFLAKASLYQLHFNLARPNSHKGGLTPWQIVHQLDPHLPPEICLLPPVFLDYRLDSTGGYDLPRFPYIDSSFRRTAASLRSSGCLTVTQLSMTPTPTAGN